MVQQGRLDVLLDCLALVVCRVGKYYTQLLAMVQLLIWLLQNVALI